VVNAYVIIKLRNKGGKIMFLGTYNYKLDDKNRIRVPARFRTELGSNFYILVGANNSLYIMGEESISKMLEKLDSMPLSDIEGQKAKSDFLASIHSPEMDNQCRFILPQGLRKYAGIEKGIVFVGAVSKIEVWSQDVYENKNIFGKTSFEDNMDKLKDYGF